MTADRLLIRDIEAVPLRIAFKEPFRFAGITRTESSNVVVRITSRDDCTGYGEACPVAAFTSESQTEIVRLIQDEVKPRLIGKDAQHIKPLVRSLQRALQHAPFTLAAVDIALWDLLGKHRGVPVYSLLGGRVRDEVEVHGSVGWAVEPHDMARNAMDQRARGFSALKTYLGRDDLDSDLKRLAQMRDAVGADVPFLVDVNGHSL